MNGYEIRQLIGEKERPVMFEIGAGQSEDTVGFLEAFKDVELFSLYCFEPDRRNIEAFKKRIHDPRCYLFEGAVGDKDGLVKFHTSTKSRYGDDLIYSSSLRRPGAEIFKIWPQFFQSEEENFEETEVRCTRLDTFVESMGIDHIDYIHADVQSAEDLLIIGGRNTLDKITKLVYTEFCVKDIYEGGPTLDEILALLPNYEIVKLFPNNTGGDVLLKNTKIEENK